MDADAVFARYCELQTYVGWTEADRQRVAGLAQLLEPHFQALIEDFYAEIARHEATLKVLTGGSPQIERLKGTLQQWLRELLSGCYDRDYVARRWRVGWRHVEIGLDQVYTNAALSRLRRGLLQAVESNWTGDPCEMLRVRAALNILLDLELALLEEAYHAEYRARMQQAERLRLADVQERALQAERLAAIGQMTTGLAHESGNALARSQAALEMLAVEVSDRPPALDLIARMQKAQDHLRQLHEDVRGYASPLKLEREVWDLGGIWRQAWHNLTMQRQGRNTKLVEPSGRKVECSVDAFRLEQVLRNIFDNSLAACADPVEIRIECASVELEGRPAVCLRIRDNGSGLDDEQKRRIFEPFYTTKTRGTGLGMAIAKRIIDAHQGRIEVGIGEASGAEIIITLPRDEG